jgi:hypothetical protein
MVIIPARQAIEGIHSIESIPGLLKRLQIRLWTYFIFILHRKKKAREFPVPSQDVTTKLSLGGNNDVITELFLPRGSLVSDIPAGDGKLVKLFYGVCVKGRW